MVQFEQLSQLCETALIMIFTAILWVFITQAYLKHLCVHSNFNAVLGGNDRERDKQSETTV